MRCRGEVFVYLGQLGQLNLSQLDLMFVKYSFSNAQLSSEPLLDCASWNSTILWENDNILKNKCNSCTNVEKRYYSMREKCPYSQYFLPVFSPNAGKYWPEKLQIRAVFTQWFLLKRFRLQNTCKTNCLLEEEVN